MRTLSSGIPINLLSVIGNTEINRGLISLQICFQAVTSTVSELTKIAPDTPMSLLGNDNLFCISQSPFDSLETKLHKPV